MKGKREEPRKKSILRQSAPPEDPFAEEEAAPKKKSGWGAYWDSGKGKILVAALSCLAVFIIVVAVVAKIWIKPPEIPISGITDPVNNTTQQPQNPEDEEPAGPTDDELYPDDGYNGDMPTVSGNRKDGWYTFLLVGTDMDDGNTDTIMVVTYDTKEQDINIMSIPRDTMINENWDIKKINSVYSRTGSSISSLATRVQKLIGFMPDFYVKVDLEMFVKLVDLVDGVEFDVPQDMNYDDDWQDLHIHLSKGLQTLDGEQAMELVRFRRYSEGDIKRVEVQQNFMKALIKECLKLEHWGKIKAYIDLAMESVQTDLDSGAVVWFAANVLGLNGVPALNMDDVYTCTLPGNYWGSAWSRTVNAMESYVTIYPSQVVKLVNERFNPYEQQVTTSMLDAMSILSNGDIASSTGSVKDAQHNAVMAVRRGEAYYDDDGKLVYGQRPAAPEQDELGNWFVLDEDGNVVYTDEQGNPLTDGPVLPPEDEFGQPIVFPVTPTDGNQGQPSGTQTDPDQTPDQPEDQEQTDPGPTQPEEPEDDLQAEPDLPVEEPVDTEPPGWLLS